MLDKSDDVERVVTCFMQMARPEMDKLREWFNNEVAVRPPSNSQSQVLTS